MIKRFLYYLLRRDIGKRLSRAYEYRWIDSEQYHRLAAIFDRTQQPFQDYGAQLAKKIIKETPPAQAGTSKRGGRTQ